MLLERASQTSRRSAGSADIPDRLTHSFTHLPNGYPETDTGLDVRQTGHLRLHSQATQQLDSRHLLNKVTLLKDDCHAAWFGFMYLTLRD